MGLLDQILGGLGGGGASGRGGLGGMAGSGGGMGRVLASLLPVVLGMLANRSRGAGSVTGGGFPGGLGAQPGGGMGGMGGMGGLGGMAGMGGLGGLLQQLTERGYGQQAQSWVSTGPNQAIDPDALSQVFGTEEISRIAAQAGVSDDEARDGLAHLLPEVVDHFTPGGTMPDDDELASRVGEYGQRFGI